MWMSDVSGDRRHANERSAPGFHHLGNCVLQTKHGADHVESEHGLETVDFLEVEWA